MEDWKIERLDLRDYIQIIRRRKLIVTVSAILIFLFYSLALYFKPAMYVAYATLILQEATLEEKLVASAYGSISQKMSLQSQLQIMQSQKMAQQVAEEIKNNTKGKINISPAEVLAMRKISQIENTGIIRVDTSSKDKNIAVEVANAYVNQGEIANKNYASSEFNDASKYIITQLSEYQNRLIKAEQDLQNFSKAEGIYDFDAQVSNKLDTLTKLEVEQVETQLQETELQRQASNLNKWASSESEFKTNAEIIPNPEIDEFKNKLFPLEMELQDLQEKYTSNHPKVIAAEKKVEKLKKEMETKVAKYLEVPKKELNPNYTYLQQQKLSQKLNLISLEVKKSALDSLLAKEKEGLKKFSSKQLLFITKLREKKTAEKLVDSLQDMLEKMKVSKVMKQGNAEVLDKASDAVSMRKVRPQDAIFVMLLSLALGLFAAVIMELLDDVLHSTHSVKRILNVNILGALPKVLSPAHRIITQLGPKSPLSEAFNKVAFQIKATAYENNMKVIVLSSPKAEEGKSTILANIGISLARSGKKVIIVDADMRRPTQHRIFGITNTVGFSSLLSGEIEAEKAISALKTSGSIDLKDEISANLQNVIVTSSVPGLYILTAGSSTYNIVEWLESSLMDTIIQELKKEYDFVLIDCPPLLEVVDANILSVKADGVVLVLDANKSRKKDAREAKQLLASRKVKILGAILNNSSDGEEYYYHYYASRSMA